MMIPKENVILKKLEDTPEIISFLWDLGLMPEQLERGSNEWHRMLGIVLGYMLKESRKTGRCPTCGQHITRPSLQKNEKASIRRLRKAGVPVKEIAKAYGRNPTTIWRVMNEKQKR